MPQNVTAKLASVDLGLLRVARSTTADALRFLESKLGDGGRHYVCFCEANLLSHLASDPALQRALAGADAVFPDGIALMTMARLRGCRLPERIAGPSFLLAACAYGVQRGWRHFFYGGAPGVADALVSRLRRDYPGICIAGAYSPPFRALTEGEECEVKQMIETSGAQMLWVGLGSPKQEFWVAERVGRVNVPLMLPVGAAFDFHTGHRPWAPLWVRAIGMEWLFRTVTGGRRTFFRNVRCVTVVTAILARVALCRLVGKRG